MFRNPERLFLAVRKIESNAIKFTPDGGKINMSLHSSGKIKFKVGGPGLGLPLQKA
jgi:signal transduction histidine kinase